MKERKSRRLSAEDRHLWDAVARTATPLDRRAAMPAPKPNPTPPDPRPSLPSFQPKSGPASQPTFSGIDAAQARRMKRGKVVIDARLDLHGLTRAQAHTRLRRFLANAVARGNRMVLVITGKGTPKAHHGANPYAGPPHMGALRQAVPHWLAEPDLAPAIAAVTPAHPSHGGTGALYIYLRRARR